MKSTSAQRFRARKIDLKKPLSIYLASELTDLDHEDLNRTLEIETGVEKEEEAEHHLQAAISAAHAAISGSNHSSRKSHSLKNSDSNLNDTSSSNNSSNIPSVYIPTPITIKDPSLKEKWYSKPAPLPKNRIRSILTIEDVCGPMYCMDEEDEKWLDSYNEKIQVEIEKIKASLDPTSDTPPKKKAKLDKLSTTTPKKQPKSKYKLKKELEDSELSNHPNYPAISAAKSKLLTEDKFELLMDQLEAVSIDMVFLSPDDFPPLQNLVSLADSKGFPLSQDAETVFDYWKSKRALTHFNPIMPFLKTDDPSKTSTDPYVCFRKREVKQLRKTRRADIKAADQLQKLQINLVCATQLLESIVSREKLKRKFLQTTKKSIEQRSLVLALRRHYGIPINSSNDLFSHKSIQNFTNRKRSSASLENDSSFNNDGSSNRFENSSSSLKKNSIKMSDLSDNEQLNHKHLTKSNGFINSEYNSSSASLKSHKHKKLSVDSSSSLLSSNERRNISLVDVPIYSVSKRVRDILEKIKQKSKKNIESTRQFIDSSSIPFNIFPENHTSGKFKPLNKTNIFNSEIARKINTNLVNVNFNNVPYVRIRQGRLGRLFLDQYLPPKNHSHNLSIFNKSNMNNQSFYNNSEQFLFRNSLLKKLDPNSTIFSSDSSQLKSSQDKSSGNNGPNKFIKIDNQAVNQPNRPDNINTPFNPKKNIFGFNKLTKYRFGSNSNDYQDILNKHISSLSSDAISKDNPLTTDTPSPNNAIFNKAEDNESDEFNNMVRIAFSFASLNPLNIPANSSANQSSIPPFDGAQPKNFDNSFLQHDDVSFEDSNSSNNLPFRNISNNNIQPNSVNRSINAANNFTNSMITNQSINPLQKKGMQTEPFNNSISATESNIFNNKIIPQNNIQNKQAPNQFQPNPQHLYQQQLRMQMQLQAYMQFELNKQVQLQMQASKNPNTPEAKAHLQQIQLTAQKLIMQQQYLQNQSKNIANNIVNINPQPIPIPPFPVHPQFVIPPQHQPQNQALQQGQQQPQIQPIPIPLPLAHTSVVAPTVFPQKVEPLETYNSNSAETTSTKPSLDTHTSENNQSSSSQLTSESNVTVISHTPSIQIKEPTVESSSQLPNTKSEANFQNKTPLQTQSSADFNASITNPNITEVRDSGSETDTDNEVANSIPDRSSRLPTSLTSRIQPSKAANGNFYIKNSISAILLDSNKKLYES
ncbi:Enhancer of polycomb-like protein 1 [Smittium culicis]|uniref:Enhancer of polycomb-like protein n=1 Tax=Smittium culicis TaxID=133412 RepID=A0A1R1YHR0_9FUNG|nr:Enhancer of polycomb-like protein 1 [Smittium culicis]